MSIRRVVTQAVAVAAFAASSFNTAYAEDWAPFWSTANLSQARSCLSGGSANGKVVFGGGHAAGGGSSVVDIYDTSTGIWTTAALSQARYAGNAMWAGSAGGKVVFGGGNTGSSDSNVVDIYDTSTGSWSAAALSQARNNMTVGSAGSKVVFAGGGITNGPYLGTVDIYDTSTGSWSTAALSQALNGFAAASVGSKIYFGGGCNNFGASGNSAVDIYDTSTGIWTTAALSQGRWGLAATSADNKVYFAGGALRNGFSNVVDIYDTTSNTWSTATLSQARAGLAGATVGNKVLFAGGGNYITGVSSVVDIYDTSTNTWSTAALSQARTNLAVASTGNQVFFAGGSQSTDGISAQSNVVDIYTIQDYPSITSSKPFTLCDQTTVAGRMQLNAPGSLNLASFNLEVGSMSGDAPIDLASQTLTVGSDGTSSTYSGTISGHGGLTKEGIGKLILSQVNTYTGDTKIEGGILSLSNPYLDDLSGVYIADGAKMDLTFGGSDVIKSLYIDGTLMAGGTWGATGSGAEYIDDVHFSGMGTLNVVPEPSTIMLLAAGAAGLMGWAWRKRPR